MDNVLLIVVYFIGLFFGIATGITLAMQMIR